MWLATVSMQPIRGELSCYSPRARERASPPPSCSRPVLHPPPPSSAPSRSSRRSPRRSQTSSWRRRRGGRSPGASTRRACATSGSRPAPTVSPKGDRVAFLNKGQVWWTPLADSAKPEQLVHARGSAQSLRWSPDGTKLAFVSGRGDHGFVGVYDVATKALNFLDASVDDDGEPVWSPDGAQLVFIRIPSAERTLPFTPRRAAPPWSIRVADLATGRGREVWKADRKSTRLNSSHDQ